MSEQVCIFSVRVSENERKEDVGDGVASERLYLALAAKSKLKFSEMRLSETSTSLFFQKHFSRFPSFL